MRMKTKTTNRTKTRRVERASLTRGVFTIAAGVVECVEWLSERPEFTARVVSFFTRAEPAPCRAPPRVVRQNAPGPMQGLPS